MSTTEFSTKAIWMAGLAILAIVMAGRRKPARAVRRVPRTGRFVAPTVAVDDGPSLAHRRPGILRRLFAGTGLGVIAVMSGALLAIFVSVVIAVAVTTLTGMLR